MKPSPSPVRPSRSPRGDVDADSLDALVSSSQRLVRFWPTPAGRPEPVVARPAAGVSVSARAQRLVAGMSEYGD
ncbi:hypothetical protein [Kitasatospora camelliae]|uniref:Uncharacterized protein n=1 Tax=Kitasatospora camelliae TaxID=3156397 RepID=A0AAU8JU00_9ACTN